MSRSPWSIGLVGVCVGVFVTDAGDRTRAEVAGEPIPLADVRSRGIAGALGVPLGKIVSIRGTAVDGDTLGDKESTGNTFLRVDRVDGRNLREAVLIEFDFHGFANDDLRKPEHGEVIVLTGWETGGYAGAVEGEFEHVRPYATTAYRFQTDFVAVKIGK